MTNNYFGMTDDEIKKEFQPLIDKWNGLLEFQTDPDDESLILVDKRTGVVTRVDSVLDAMTPAQAVKEFDSMMTTIYEAYQNFKDEQNGHKQQKWLSFMFTEQLCCS